ncbi:MAG: hypothetical protein K5683_07400 [Prevotella sp.]|nr:hypothetical protein [Prevotella sp.]
MKRSERWMNAVLVVLAVALLAICVRSVVHEQQKEATIEQTNDGREQ